MRWARAGREISWGLKVECIQKGLWWPKNPSKTRCPFSFGFCPKQGPKRAPYLQGFLIHSTQRVWGLHHSNDKSRIANYWSSFHWPGPENQRPFFAPKGRSKPAAKEEPWHTIDQSCIVGLTKSPLDLQMHHSEEIKLKQRVSARQRQKPQNAKNREPGFNPIYGSRYWKEYHAAHYPWHLLRHLGALRIQAKDDQVSCICSLMPNKPIYLLLEFLAKFDDCG